MKKNTLLNILACFIIFFGSCTKNTANQNGAVSSTSKIASQVGIDILKQGGNAFDALVATGFALAVTSPANGNLGGGGFLVARTSSGEIISLDFREKAPKSSFEKMFLDDQQNYDKDIAWFSHKSSGVPGTVEGLIRIFEDYGSGKFSLQQIIEPAIELAENGFKLEEAAAFSFDNYKFDFLKDSGSKDIFIKNNKEVLSINNQFKDKKISEKDFKRTLDEIDIWKEGDIFVQQDLSNTLKRIAMNGRDGFYKGKTADLIVEEMKKNGGLISKDDLLKYNSEYRVPIIGTYKNYIIASMGPPSSGGTLLVQMLNMLENFNIADMKRNSTEYVHLLTEVQRLAYADRSIHLGDPDFWDNPVEVLISKRYAKERLNLISLEQATPSSEIAAGHQFAESNETTHYSVMDKYGNTAGITTTINFSYGNKKIVDGAGFLLNNEMDDFSAKPNVPNAFGLVGDKANAIEPYKRPLSSMSPTLVIDEKGETILTLGAAGGSRIITTVLQIILSVVDHELNLQKAIDHPRTHSQWVPDLIFHEEKSLSSKTIKQLKDLKHNFYDQTTYLARAHGIQKKNGIFITGADKRGEYNGKEAITY